MDDTNIANYADDNMVYTNITAEDIELELL